MPVIYNPYLLQRVTDKDTLADAQRRKRVARSYEGILYALSVLYEKDILTDTQGLVNTIRIKYDTKELYFDLCYIFYHYANEFDGLVMENL